MGDNDPTPQAGPHARARSQWGDEERAIVGAGHRRENRSHPLGVPLVAQPAADYPEEPTDPFDLVALFDQEPSAKDQEVVRRSKRVSNGQMVTVDQLVSVVRTMFTRVVAIEKVIEKMERKTAPILRAWDWALAGVGAAAVAVGIFLYSRGGDERAVQMRLDALERADRARGEQLEKSLGEIQRDIRALERRGDNHKEP